ncbi:thiamine diphosphokinase [Limimaricola pyoseonensis]|uniref:Thiamine diphosphokinase n=1 Tax=Limimaricola pyoseonensis TaxID=521013 RepID=A0A1G7CQU6_9RHOB|nr:thiamine diphosphokinase [Limimaricola pyoseonensis]SDE41732.1 thiamine pyrophosphokinase [Limimaricola pyoseonensis]
MPIVQSAGAVTLLGGGALFPQDLECALERAPVLVAADGGAEHARRAGAMPRAVIGDMDSLGDCAESFADRIHEIAEQDSTDFDKALRNIDAPLVLAIGFTGGRIDHELAVYHVLAARPDRACLVIGAQSLVCHCPPELAVDLPPGTAFSLFPMAPVRIASEGLRWPTAGLDFAPDRRVGTSNEATGPVRLRAEAPGMLAIAPRAALDAVIAGLRAAPRCWPAR